MSIKIMSEVWAHADSEGGELLVLLALADFANDDGWCFPSVATIAAKARLQERQTRILIRRLEMKGLVLCPSTKGGAGNSNRYRVMPIKAAEEGGKGAPECRDAKAERGHSNAEKGAFQCTKGGTPVPPNRHEPSEEASIDKRAQAPAPPRRVSVADLSDLMSKEQARGYLDHRRALKAPLTPRALALLRGELTKLASLGYDPGEAIDTAIERGWRGLKADWIINANGTGNNAQPKSQADQLAGDLEFWAEIDRREAAARAQGQHFGNQGGPFGGPDDQGGHDPGSFGDVVPLLSSRATRRR